MDEQVELKTGVKYDSGKPRMELLSPFALEEMAKVMTMGAVKYGDENWRMGLSWRRVLGAVLRHVFAYMRREDKDPETGLSHLAHASCGLMFLLEYSTSHKELDDRYSTRREPLAF